MNKKKILSMVLALVLLFSGIQAFQFTAHAALPTSDGVTTFAEGNIARDPAVLTYQAVGTPGINASYSNTTNGTASVQVPRINNGALASGGGNDQGWNSWNTSNFPVTVTITWPTPYVIDATRVMWWYDGTGSGAGVSLPGSCAVQYWDGTAWINVSNMKNAAGSAVTSVGVAGGGTYGTNRTWNGVTFDPVATTRLRLSIAKGAGTGVGIGEWEVFGNSGDPELVSVSVAGNNQPVISETNTYTANVVYPNLEGITYEWSVAGDNVRIVGDNTGKTVNVEAMSVGTAKLSVTAKHNSGVRETAGSMDITVKNISVSVTGDPVVPTGDQRVFTADTAVGTLTDIAYEWSLNNENARIVGSATGKTVTVEGVTKGDARLTVRISHAGRDLEATSYVDLSVKAFEAKDYVTNTAAGKAPILPRRVVVDGLRFDLPTASAIGNKNYNFAEQFEESLVPVTWDMDSFTQADYAADKIGTSFEVTGTTAAGSRAPGLPVKAIITVQEPQTAIDYNHSVTSENVIFDDNFWKPKQLVNATTTFDQAVAMLESTSSSRYAVQNFKNSITRLTSIWNGNLSPSNPTYNGYVFQDTDVYKTLEGFSYNLAAVWDDPSVTNARKAELLNKVKEWISLIEQVQYADGYITTAFSSRYQGSSGGEGTGNWRWRYFARHEMYNIGHFIEAAVAYTRFSEGAGEYDYTLYEVGKRAADHIVNVFGPNGYRVEVPGHQEIELALMKWATLVEEYEGVGAGQKYRDTVETLIDRRGRRTGAYQRESTYNAGTYSQDATPLVDETRAVGHAVRAMYYYTGATDVAISMPDSNPNKTAFLNGITNIYNTASERNTYITGGLGSGETSEGFGPDYRIRNTSAYTENCAAIAGANWYQRLNLYYEDAKYADAYERALYNGVLVGVNLTGNRFYYGCGLDGTSQTRGEWQGCACCPPNVIRTIANIGGYVYTVNQDKVFVNLYGGSTGNINVEGENVKIVQETNYPWEGAVKLTVTPETDKEMTLNLRIPGWVKAQKYQQVTIKVDGVEIDSTPSEKGYVSIDKTWLTTGTVIEMDIPMEIRLTEGDDNVQAVYDELASAVINVDYGQSNKVVVERGPIVYHLETPGVPNGDPATATTGKDARYVYIPRNAELTASYNPNLLRGVVEITGYAKWCNEGLTTVRYNNQDYVVNPYHPGTGEADQYIQLTPYYTKENRGNNPQNLGNSGQLSGTNSFRVWTYATEKTVQIRGEKNKLPAGETTSLTAVPHVNYNEMDEAISYEWSVEGAAEIVNIADGKTDNTGPGKIGGIGYERDTSIATIKVTGDGPALITVDLKDETGAVIDTDDYIINGADISIDDRLSIEIDSLPRKTSSVYNPSFNITANEAMEDVMLIVAEYDADGRMVNYKSEVFALEADVTKSVQASIDYDPAKTYRYFIWDAGYKPLAMNIS